MKNVGPFLAFNKGWFEKHQSALLWLLNNPLTKRAFRCVLRIRKHDVGYDKIIVRILPNSYTVLNRFIDEKTVELTSDFRTHPKYAKRIYYAFRPVWWLLHFWDWLLADRFIPAWSFGFDTLTAFPDPATGATTVDGVVKRSAVDETFSTIRSSAGTSNAPTASSIQMQLVASTTTNQFSELQRFVMNFDTASLGTNVVVSSAILSLNGFSWNNNIGTPDINVCASNSSANNNLANSDYGTFGSTAFSTKINGFSWSSSGYNDFTLNGNGLSNINNTGVSKFGAVFDWDLQGSFTGSWVSGQGSWFSFFGADQTGTSNDPKLVITYQIRIPVYSIPGVSISKLYQTIGY